MNTKREPRRRRERMRMALPVMVHCRESSEIEWSELTRCLDVTPFGASFSTSRPVEVGRLVHLTMPMPRQMRCFDHTADQYCVWALVRYAKPLPASGLRSAKESYAIGVAFVGKNPPESYEIKPQTTYHAEARETEAGAVKGGAEAVVAALPETTPPRARTAPLIVRVREEEPPAPSVEEEKGEEPERNEAQKDARDGTRLNLPMEVILEVVDESGSEARMREQTVTENISRRGASVFTTFHIGRGTRVRLTSARFKIAVNAFVLARRVGADGLPRLHLQFTDEQWPLEGVE